MEQGEARCENAIPKIVEIRAEFVRGEQRFVNDGGRRTRKQRRRRAEFPQRLFDHARGATHALADVARPHVHDQLLEHGARGERLHAEHVVVGAGGPPAQRRYVERMYAALDRGARGGGGIRFARQKEADRGEMIRRSVQIDVRELAREEPARRLAQNAGAVARAAVGRARAAMHHGARGLQSERHDAMRRRAAEVRDETDATGVVLFRQAGGGQVR